MDFFDHLLDFFTIVLGGGCVILLSISSILCSLSALLSISEENRFFFERTLKTVGILISFFGLLLPFRNITFFATLICFWWTSLIFNLIPLFQIIQFTIASALSVFYWFYYVISSDDIALQKITDIIIFVIFPFIFTLTNFSRGADSLSVKDKTSAPGPKIPLRSFNNKCIFFLNQLFPQTN